MIHCKDWKTFLEWQATGEYSAVSNEIAQQILDFILAREKEFTVFCSGDLAKAQKLLKPESGMTVMDLLQVLSPVPFTTEVYIQIWAQADGWHTAKLNGVSVGAEVVCLSDAVYLEEPK